MEFNTAEAAITAVVCLSAVTIAAADAPQRASELQLLVDAAKILVPAAGAWIAAWLANRREHKQWIKQQEDQHQKAFASQSDRLSASWAEMTTQAREIITRLQVETIDAKTRAAVAEERIQSLERDLVDVRMRYEAAKLEIENLRTNRPR